MFSLLLGVLIPAHFLPPRWNRQAHCHQILQNLKHSAHIIWHNCNPMIVNHCGPIHKIQGVCMSLVALPHCVIMLHLPLWWTPEPFSAGSSSSEKPLLCFRNCCTAFSLTSSFAPQPAATIFQFLLWHRSLLSSSIPLLCCDIALQ